MHNGYIMTNQNEVVLLLKTPMLELDGRPVKNFDKVKDCRMPNGTMKTAEEMREQPDCPNYTMGEGLANFIMRHVQPKDPAEVARQNRIGRKISNATFTAKGELQADERLLADIVELLQRVTLRPDSAHLLGDCLAFIQDAQDKLRQQQKG